MTAALSWLATYMVHSTVLLTAAWAVDRVAARRRPAAAEVAWRAAIVGGLVSASLSGVLGPGLVVLPTAARDHGTSPVPASAMPWADIAPAAPGVESRPRPTAANLDLQRPESAAPTIATVGWAAGALLLLARLATSAHKLRRLLRDRRRRPAGRTLRRLARALGIRRPVLLSTSRLMAVPFTTGVVRPEVCCPEPMFIDLPARLQEAILAHELAHVRRHDVAWRRAARVLEAVLWMQPLNRIARRRLDAVGETLCDLRAAACTGRPRDLASSLVEVAARTAGNPLPSAAMAPGAQLDDRVRRLLEESMTESPSPWSVPAAVAAVIAAALALPALSFGDSAGPAAPAPLTATAAVAAAPSEDAPPAPPTPESDVPRAAEPPTPPATAAPAPRAPAPVPPRLDVNAAAAVRIEDAIVDGLVSKQVLGEGVDPDEVRRMIEEIVAREVSHLEIEERRRARDVRMQREREMRAAARARVRGLERRSREEVAAEQARIRELERAAREAAAAEPDADPEEIERMVRELVERAVRERQVVAEQRAAETAAEAGADQAALDARAKMLEEQARALAEEQRRLEVEAARLAEEAERLRSERHSDE